MKTFEQIDTKDTRSGFGEGLVELGREHEDVIGLCADLAGSLKMNSFADEFPDRFYQCGVAEANMMSVAAGLTIEGKVPFTGTFANFSTGRVYDQIRQSIAYSEKNVKLCASHCGLTLGEDGATHQMLEDLGMMRMLPNMTVISPCDFNQTKAATKAIYEHEGPVYLRFGRPKMPVFTPPDQKFEIGKADVLNEGSDVTIIATGHLVWKAIEAGYQLSENGIEPEIINVHTIKPLDEETILNSIKKTNCVVTAEEHQSYGGLGDLISSLTSMKCPTPQRKVAVMDSFGESGKPQDLMAKYNIDTPDIVSNVKEVIATKKGIVES
ncbi:MAG: transketolase family protein [Flavobacteriales bacterium]